MRKPPKRIRWPVDTAPPPTGFQMVAGRWVVGRTVAWRGRHRCLSKEYEVLPKTGEAWIDLAMSRLMVVRPAP